jgi:hypothetical protein
MGRDDAAPPPFFSWTWISDRVGNIIIDWYLSPTSIGIYPSFLRRKSYQIVN